MQQRYARSLGVAAIISLVLGGLEPATAQDGSRKDPSATTANAEATNAGESSPEARVDGPSGLHELIASHARRHGVPVALARAVVEVESNYNAKARGRAGEIGLMQIKSTTARGIGFTGKTSALYDPETNLKWGMRYLGKAYALAGGSVCGTILRYNAGHYAKRMNPVSRRYCQKVQALMKHTGTNAKKS